MDTVQVVAHSFLPVFWKFFLIGLVGYGLHILKQLKDKNIEEKTLSEYWDKRKWEILWGLASYWVLVWIWHDWTLVSYISYVGIDIDKIPLNGGTIFVGYFSSSIMGVVITLWEYFGEKLGKMFTKKIDSLGEPKP